MALCRSLMVLLAGMFATLPAPGADGAGGQTQTGGEPPPAAEESPAPLEDRAESPDDAKADAANPANGGDRPEAGADGGGPVDVYVVPITEMIAKPNLYILRRGLKEAIANDVEMVILDMDTPGGRVDITIEMMEILDRFEGITATYVNDDAISAGSFIAASTEEIYFAPRGKIGASAVIQGTGEEVPETAKKKIESYLRANIRVVTEDAPYRAEVIRAMLDAEYELKIGDEVIKPAGELLTLTAREAIREYGDPPRKLLGESIHESIGDLLDARFGKDGYVVRNFEITYSEKLAKWMNGIAPILMGLGALLLFIEFKTPGFGVFGIGGLILLGVFFISHYIAGLAGNEPILFFVLGIVLVLVELFFLPGVAFLALTGLGLIFGSLLWAMVDFWPGGGTELNAVMFAEPMVNLIFGLSIAMLGAYLISKWMPGTWMERQLVLKDAVGGEHEGAPTPEADRGRPAPGARGRAVTDLFPSGHVEIDGRRYDARAVVGMLKHGTPVKVVKAGDFHLLVEEDTACS